MITHEIEDWAKDDPWDHVQATLNTLTNRVEIRIYGPLWPERPEEKPLFCIAGNIDTVKRLIEVIGVHANVIGRPSASENTDPNPQSAPN